MGDLDLTEAIEVAVVSMQQGEADNAGIDIACVWVDEGLIEAAVKASAPLIVAQLRAQIASDLASHINDKHTPQWNNAMECAVEVAAGGAL